MKYSVGLPISNGRHRVKCANCVTKCKMDASESRSYLQPVVSVWKHFGLKNDNSAQRKPCNLYAMQAEGVSLITGMEYGTEQWNGKWNGTVNIHSCS